MFFSFKIMSTYEWIKIINDDFLIYTEYNSGNTGNAELEIERCKKWKAASIPLMERAEKHIKNNLPDITNDLGIDLIKYDSLYPLVREEIIDRLSIQRYLEKDTDICRYRMRFFDVKFVNSKATKDLLSIEPKNSLSRIDIELAFKKLPEKSILKELKIRLMKCLKRIE